MEQAADPVERVVLLATVPEPLLLEAAADQVDDLGEADDMDCFQDGDGDGVAAERVQRGMLHAIGEPVRWDFSDLL